MRGKFGKGPGGGEGSKKWASGVMRVVWGPARTVAPGDASCFTRKMENKK